MDGLDIVVEAGAWDEEAFATVAERAVIATLAHQNLDLDLCEVTVMGCDDTRIADLNAEFRGKARPTNVLSWPAQALAPTTPGAAPPPPQAGFDGMFELGDIALSYETCAQEAAESTKAFDDHLTHLVVHATLHLLGYDHESDGDAALMEGLEVEILGNLGLDDPYRNDQATEAAP